MKNAKEILYLVLWVITGILLMLLLGGIVEFVSLELYGGLSLTLVLYGTMTAIGMVLGIILGPLAWHKIYVEGVRGKKYTKNK